jgi:hypothetical protein
MERGQTCAWAVRGHKANPELLRSPSKCRKVHLEARTRIPVEVHHRGTIGIAVLRSSRMARGVSTPVSATAGMSGGRRPAPALWLGFEGFLPLTVTGPQNAADMRASAAAPI